MTHDNIQKEFKENKFIARQFFDTPNHYQVLEDLRWRHFMVFWSAHYATRATSSTCKNFVECGVCDGLTIKYALAAASYEKTEFHAYLLDSWDDFDTGQLLDGENSHDYNYLSLEATKKNLVDFEKHTTFIKGYIPDSLTQIEFPSSIAWLHIDLNAAKPTKDSLEFFYKKMEVGSVFLFDDYAGLGYESTRQIVDNFFVDKSECIFFHLPTNNAIAFKIR